jgi:hypothetical protein
VPKHADARKWIVDRFRPASRLRRDGVIAYHAATELQGCIYTEGHQVQVIARDLPLHQAIARLRPSGWRA